MENLWSTFRNWVSSWPTAVFMAVVLIAVVFTLLLVKDFVKKSYATKGGEAKPIKWTKIILVIILDLIVLVLCLAKYV